MAQVGDHSRPNEHFERQFMNLPAALDEMLRSIDVTAGVQPHVDAADDLARTTRRIEVLDAGVRI
jgi:hypothetical protein